MINSAFKYLVLIFFILFPIFYLPITSEAYEYNKMALLVFSSCFLFVLFLVQSAHARKFVIQRSSFSALLLFLAGITLISTLLQSPNLVVSLTTPLSASTMISGVLWYFLLTNIDSSDLMKFFGICLFGASMVAISAILLYFGILPGGFYTPAGSLLSTALFLSTALVCMIGIVISSLTRNKISLLPYFAAILLVGISLILITNQLFTGKNPVILPFQYGWIAFLEILKNIKTLVLGVGPSNFITAFTLTKPVSFNLLPQWNVIFTSSSSYLLNLGTETGVLAVICYLLILLKSIRLLFNKPQDLLLLPFRFTLVFTLILQILLPSNMTLFILTIILLAICAERNEKIEIGFGKLGVFSYLLILPPLVLTGIILYFGSRFYLADIYFKSSLDNLLNNRATQAYDDQNKAIKYNPYIDRYHAAFSQTNLSLANALAAKDKLTDTDKQNIPNLVKQSIDHAQTAVNLYKTNVVNWDNLGKIYISLRGYAEGAQDWTAATLIQKINLDPAGPNSYFTLGILYMNDKKYDEAEKYLRQASFLKPDYANARYNLYLTLSAQKKYKEAYQELQTTSKLLTPGSADAKKVEKELADLEKLL